MKRSMELLKRSGILVKRAIWSEKGKCSVLKMSLILGVLSFLLGLVDVSTLEEMVFASNAIPVEAQLRKTVPPAEPKPGVHPGARRPIRTNADNGDPD